MTLAISQNGITPIDNLKPLDKVIVKQDTLILLSHDMLKMVNLTILQNSVYIEHIDSLEIIICNQNEVISAYVLIDESWKRESIEWEKKEDLYKRELRKKERSIVWLKIGTGVVVTITILKFIFG